MITAAPGLYWLDSGELTAAGYQLGTAHPPGYPLHTLLCKLATLVPLGSIAFRVVLLSAAAAAATVAGVFVLSVRLIRSIRFAEAPRAVGWIGGVAGALLVALGHMFWRQATVAEVYSLAALAVAGSLLLLWRVLRTPDPRWRLLTAFAAGLAALGTHPTYRVLVLPVLLGGWLLALRRGARWARAAPALFALGALVVIYLVAVADRGRLPDWAHATSLGALWDHVMARRIREADFGVLMFSLRPEVVGLHLRQAWETILEPFVGIALPLAAVGAGRLLIRPGTPRILGIALCWGAAGDFVYSFWINPMGLRDLQCGITTVVCLGPLAAVGLATVAAWISQRSARLVPAVAIALAGIAVLPPTLDNLREKWRGAGYGAAAWSDAALVQAPPRAVVLTQSDDLSAGLLHAQAVEGARPDVLVLVRQHLWVAHDLRLRLALDDDPDLSQRAIRGYLHRPRQARLRGRLNLLAELLGRFEGRRPVRWEPGDGVDLPALRRPLTPGVPLFSVIPRGTKAALPEPGDLVRDVMRILEGDPGDQTARVRSRHLNALGMQYLRRRADPAVLPVAQGLFTLAQRAWPPSVAARINRGVVLARRAELASKAGDEDRARELLRQAARATEGALERAPGRYVGLVNAGRYRLRLAELSGPADGAAALRQTRRAREHFRRARRRYPERAAPHFNLGVIEARLQRYRAAREHFRAAVERAPRDRAARAYLERVEAELRRRGSSR